MVAQPALLKQVALELTIDPAVTTIEVDARRLKQILVNLLVNAVKFTPSSGQVGLAVQGDPMRQALSFTVWDTGIGIAPDDQRRLFQPFVQLDPALSRQHGGAGLGLALVLRLVRLHQGSVTLESSPEAGSRFRVTLPWLQPSAEQSASAPGAALLAGQLVRPASTGAPPRILVAEDHEANSALLRDALTAAGYTVAVVRSGVEVLPRAEEFAPALILLDIQLPGIDGLTAIRQLRADPALASIPIIALTALAMPGDRERCLATGASAYLAKPVSLRILAATMAELLAAPDSETK
jgi:CheY-like chemotaxis protein